MLNLSKNKQKLLCWIPGVSTLLILFVTYHNFAKRKVGFQKWILFFLVMVGATVAVFFLNEFVLSGLFPILDFIATTLCFTVANLILIDLQEGEKEPSNEMNPGKKSVGKKRSQIMFIVIVGVAIIALFCSTALPSLIQAFRFESKYIDQNGAEDFALTDLNDEDILSDEYEMKMTSKSFDGNATNVKGELRDCDWDVCKVQAKILDGVYTAQATNIEQDMLILEVNSTVKAGNFAIYVLIDGKLYRQVEANCEKQIQLQGIKNKTVLVKIAGEGADFAFEVNRKTGNNSVS